MFVDVIKSKRREMKGLMFYRNLDVLALYEIKLKRNGDFLARSLHYKSGVGVCFRPKVEVAVLLKGVD